MWKLLAILLHLRLAGSLHAEKVEVQVSAGPMGRMRGVVKHSKPYPNQDAPHYSRDIYMFRNIPYAEESVAGPNRFKQSRVRTTPYNTEGEPALDATRTGPLCQQGGLNGGSLAEVFDQTLQQFLEANLPMEIPPVLIGLLLSTVEIVAELPPGTLDPDKKIKDIAHDWLDVDFGVEEDCLHLAVSTPLLPDGTAKPNLPVMFYIHGGGFSSGFQIKMGPERLMAWNDVVLVAINYRLAVMGFLCLDTDEAGGNMGMLDMVTALEWVHNNIAYFGGNPNEITIFGESAGSATIGHMLLSSETNDLFARGIGSSGSPLASWAFDYESEKNSRGIAARANCTQADPDDLVDCLRNLPAVTLSKAFTEYQNEARFNGGLGFGGSSPCAQTKGVRKFYTADQTPHSILFSGDYQSAPIFFGANKNEGSYVYTVIYNEFLVPNNLENDQEFIKYGIIPKLLESTQVSNFYAFKETVRDNYFDEGQVGDLTKMVPGLVDFFSVMFFKASAYEMVQQNSKYSDSFWYAFDFSDTDKSLLNLQYINPADKANLTDPGTSHGDESIYLFDLEIPLVFCNLGEILADAAECLGQIDALFCLTLPTGKFRQKWHDCLTGELSKKEEAVSANLVKLWTNFATEGSPGLGLRPWSRSNPEYIKITDEVSIREDYTTEYHIALEESRS